MENPKIKEIKVEDIPLDWVIFPRVTNKFDVCPGTERIWSGNVQTYYPCSFDKKPKRDLNNSKDIYLLKLDIDYPIEYECDATLEYVVSWVATILSKKIENIEKYGFNDYEFINLYKIIY